jgi:hypothetical protein
VVGDCLLTPVNQINRCVCILVTATGASYYNRSDHTHYCVAAAILYLCCVYILIHSWINIFFEKKHLFENDMIFLFFFFVSGELCPTVVSAILI